MQQKPKTIPSNFGANKDKYLPLRVRSYSQNEDNEGNHILLKIDLVRKI